MTGFLPLTNSPETGVLFYSDFPLISSPPNYVFRYVFRIPSTRVLEPKDEKAEYDIPCYSWSDAGNHSSSVSVDQKSRPFHGTDCSHLSPEHSVYSMGNRWYLCRSPAHSFTRLNRQFYWLASRQSVSIRTRICFTWNCHPWRFEPLAAGELLDCTCGCTIDVSIRRCRNPYSRFARTWKFCTGKCWTNSLLRHLRSVSRYKPIGASSKVSEDNQRIANASQRRLWLFELWSLANSKQDRVAGQIMTNGPLNTPNRSTIPRTLP